MKKQPTIEDSYRTAMVLRFAATAAPLFFLSFWARVRTR